MTYYHTNEEAVRIDCKDMHRFTSDPLGWRCVDRVEVNAGKYAIGIKAVSSLDWLVSLHFPEHPIMPGGILMEVIMQTAVFAVNAISEVSETLMFFHACKSMKMERIVEPGDLLIARAELKSYRGGVAVFSDEAMVDGGRVCAMDFTLVKPHDLVKINPKGL